MPLRLPPTAPYALAPKTGIFAVKKAQMQCGRRLIYFGTAIPAGCWRLLDICINKSWKDLCLRCSVARHRLFSESLFLWCHFWRFFKNKKVFPKHGSIWRALKC